MYQRRDQSHGTFSILLGLSANIPSWALNQKNLLFQRYHSHSSTVECIELRCLDNVFVRVKCQCVPNEHKLSRWKLEESASEN